MGWLQDLLDADEDAWVVLGKNGGGQIVNRETATAQQLRDHAEHVRMIADGGYIVGDHDEADMKRMRKEADDLLLLAKKRERQALSEGNSK